MTKSRLSKEDMNAVRDLARAAEQKASGIIDRLKFLLVDLQANGPQGCAFSLEMLKESVNSTNFWVGAIVKKVAPENGDD